MNNHARRVLKSRIKNLPLEDQVRAVLAAVRDSYHLDPTVAELALNEEFARDVDPAGPWFHGGVAD